MSVMTTMLRRHGASMRERHGREVATDFGSPASEAAVCRSGVGLAERSDRATIELRGAPEAIEEALGGLQHLGPAAWWVHPTSRRAIVRCEGEAADGCISALRRAEEVAVNDVSDHHAAVDLIGPKAQEVVDSHLAMPESPVALIVRRGELCVELLVPRVYGPALWSGLLEEGEPWGIACVGLDAIENLDLSDRLDRRRQPQAAG